MTDWILHIDETTRALVAGVIDETLALLPSRAEWTPTEDRALEVTIQRAVRLEGSRRAVRLVARDDMLGLHAPASGTPMRRRLAVFGRLASMADGTDPGLRSEATLRAWQAGLKAPVDAARSAEAERFRTAAAMLALGAVDTLDVAWDWFNVMTGSRGRHSITLRPSAAPRGDLISFNASASVGPRMTPGLVEAFDEIVGDRVHVSEGHARSASDMPSIAIGDLPWTKITSDANPVDRLTAVAALPTNARLLLD